VSPELERLLSALYERDTCEPEHRAKHENNVRRLIQDALSRVPHSSRDQFLEAIGERYRQFVRSHRQPPTMLPRA
jgi:hypothetical protein